MIYIAQYIANNINILQLFIGQKNESQNNTKYLKIPESDPNVGAWFWTSGSVIWNAKIILADSEI